jgi:hypothetical protein
MGDDDDPVEELAVRLREECEVLRDELAVMHARVCALEAVFARGGPARDDTTIFVRHEDLLW